MKILSLSALLPIKLQTQPTAAPFQKSYIKRLFNDMSASYEMMNYVTSFGFSFFWRKQFLQDLPAHGAPVQVADLMTGMGETWGHLFSRWKNAQLTALDFSEGMLRCAAQRNRQTYGNRVTLSQNDVLQNSLPAASFDMVTCAFGLKTLDQGQMQALARETRRILKPNGKFAFVEISEPTFKPLRLMYLLYIRYFIPILGYILAREYGPYKMLGYYTQTFRNAQKAADIFRATGLTVTYRNYFFGCATGFYGSKDQPDAL